MGLIARAGGCVVVVLAGVLAPTAIGSGIREYFPHMICQPIANCPSSASGSYLINNDVCPNITGDTCGYCFRHDAQEDCNHNEPTDCTRTTWFDGTESCGPEYSCGTASGQGPCTGAQPNGDDCPKSECPVPPIEG